jgi:hypothetical protein
MTDRYEQIYNTEFEPFLLDEQNLRVDPCIIVCSPLAIYLV